MFSLFIFYSAVVLRRVSSWIQEAVQDADTHRCWLAGSREFFTQSSLLSCAFENIRENKKKFIYLPADPVIWVIGSASVSFKGHPSYSLHRGGSLRVIGRRWFAPSL